MSNTMMLESPAMIPSVDELARMFPELTGFGDLSTDDLIEIDGGSWSWKGFGQWVVAGAAGGAAGGALGGSVAVPVIGSVPGWVAGGALGAIAGAGAYAVAGWW
jgi:hypothetical protein